jgi:hypothetical protein
MASKSADEFKKTLAELRCKYEREADDSELSPEYKRQCLESLKGTIKALIKIEKDLTSAEGIGRKSSDVVQVMNIGIHCSNYNCPVPSKGDFRRSFDMLFDVQRRMHSPKAFNVEIVSLDIERNYKLDKDMRVDVKPTLEFFIKFESEEQACMVLGMKSMTLMFGQLRVTVEFVQPTQSYATRKTFRTIGDSIVRLNAIEDEYKKIGAVRQMGGKPTLSDKYLDKSWFIRELERAKALRASGQSLDHNMHGPLRGRRPVDSTAKQAQITALYDEECDILIKLREFQLNGVDFDF